MSNCWSRDRLDGSWGRVGRCTNSLTKWFVSNKNNQLCKKNKNYKCRKGIDCECKFKYVQWISVQALRVIQSYSLLDSVSRIHRDNPYCSVKISFTFQLFITFLFAMNLIFFSICSLRLPLSISLDTEVKELA